MTHASAAQDESIDLLSILRTLWLGRLVVLACMAAAVMVGGYYAYGVATPVYRATSVVMLESREASVAGLDSVLGGLTTSTSVVNTEVEVLRGRTLMGRVVDTLDLTSDPEFNGTLRPPSHTDQLRGWVRNLLTADTDAAPALSPEARAARERSATISALLNQVEIRNVSNSLVFQITVSSLSSSKSAMIADTIAELYIQDQLRVRFEATEAATTWLSDQVASLRSAFEEADAQVRAARAETNVIDAVTLAAMDRQVKDTRRRIEQISAQISSLDARIARISAAPTRTEKAQAAESDFLIGLAGRTELPGADSTLATEFDTQLARLVLSLSQDRDRLRSQEISLTDAERTLSVEFDRQSQDLAELTLLTRTAESAQLLYEHFQTRLSETAVQQGIQQADSRILSMAVPPRNPSEPRRSLILAVSAILGLLIGAGIVFLRERLANGIRSSRELEELVGRPVLAQIPLIRVNSRRGVVDYLAEKPTSAAAEAVRNLRTGILLSSPDRAPKVLVITSSIPGEGKTTATMALAQNLTAMGRKVLLIEGDIRICTLNQYLDDEVMTSPGVVSVITGDASLAEAVRPAKGIGDVLPGRKVAVNAADIFSSGRFADMVAEARVRYDMVLIDTPPVLVVPDAKVIAQQADATVFAVRWDRTSKAQIREALHQLAQVRVRIAGLVLGHVDPKGMRRYGYGESYGAYAKYGKKYYGAS